MDSSIKEQYKLPKKEHEDIYKKIEKEIFSRSRQSEKPKNVRRD